MKFALTKDQSTAARKWIVKREKVSPSFKTATGGRFTYEFTPTSVGTVVVIRDAHNRAKINLSDYKNW